MPEVPWPAEMQDTITVSPSIHFIDYFHSPNPVIFRVIDKPVSVET